MLWQIIGGMVILLGASLDVLTLRLALLRIKNGRGTSGIPLFPLLMYWIVVGCWGGDWPIKIVALVGFTAFHVAMQYIIPYAVQNRADTRR